MIILPHVFILRGLAGSGKSTLARQIKNSLNCPVSIISTDHFFTSPDDQCHFDSSQLGMAHRQCWEQYMLLLRCGQAVIVDNTNGKVWHYNKYHGQAVASGWPVSILEIPCLDLDMLRLFHRRSLHRVPFEVMRTMYNNWEIDSRATIVLNPFSFVHKMTA